MPACDSSRTSADPIPDVSTGTPLFGAAWSAGFRNFLGRFSSPGGKTCTCGLLQRRGSPGKDSYPPSHNTYWKSGTGKGPWRVLEFAGVALDSINIRRLQSTPDDISVMARWLSDPRVLEYYEGRDNPFDEEAIRTKFIGKLKSEETPCIIEFEGRPLGYLQFYPVDAEGREYYGGLDREPAVYGLDLFIGEPDYWSRGIGTRALSIVLRYLFDELGADMAVLDPHVGNPRAIRSYEKCGFRKVKVLPAHEQHEGVLCDCWLMAVTPDSFRRANPLSGATAPEAARANSPSGAGEVAG